MTTLIVRCALFGFLLVQGCASVDNVIVAEPGMAFSLPLGKTAALTGSSVRLTFRQVSEDSRCPRSVVCVWEGDARIEITVAREGVPDESRTLSLAKQNNEARIGDLLVQFVGLAPYPATPDPAAPRRYVAQMVIRSL